MVLHGLIEDRSIDVTRCVDGAFDMPCVVLCKLLMTILLRKMWYQAFRIFLFSSPEWYDTVCDVSFQAH